MITATSTSLLCALRDPRNDTVWTEFCARYQPLLVSFAQRLGLNEHDAQDAAQEALTAFVNEYQQGRYDRHKGRLRAWLSAIARNKIRDIQRKRREMLLGQDTEATGFMEKIPDDQSMSELWEAEWHRAIVKQCMEEVAREVEPRTMEAFELLVLQEWPVGQVVQHLGISRNAVYKAKSHVLSRMRKYQEYLEENW